MTPLTPPSGTAGLGAVRPNAPQAEPPSTDPLAAQALNSQELMQGRKTVAISHNGSVYRLQATRQGKLILTK